MLRNRPLRRRAGAFASGATGIGLVMLVVVQTTLASAAPRGETLTALSSCTQYAGTSLTGFIAAGEISYPHTECLSSVGESLTIAATAHITTSVALNFEGATVTGTSSVKGAMLSVGAISSIKKLTLDQGSGVSNGIDCNAACTITTSTIEGMKRNGISVSGKTSDGSVIGGTSTATEVSTTGTTLSGLFFNHAADITVGYVTSSYDNLRGVDFNSVSAPCSVRSITVTDLGQPDATWELSTNDSGAGLALVGTGTTSGTGCSFQSVTDSGNGGYGMTLANASFNTFVKVSVTGEPKGELNSGINIAKDSNDNTFTTATIDHEATGVDIGIDGVKGGGGEAGNDDNAFVTLNVSNDTYGSISITGGSDNIFTTVTGTSEGNDANGKSFYVGLIDFQYEPSNLTCAGDTAPCPVSHNTVTQASFAGAPSEKYDIARYLVYADAVTSGNAVTLATPAAVTYAISPCNDAASGNDFQGCGS